MRGLSALAAAAAVAGCGAGSPDLFEVTRTGAGAGADVHLVVSDAGTVSCGDTERALGSERLLDARALARELESLAALDVELAPGRGAQLRYRVRTEAGTVTFSDTSRGRPAAFDRVVAFTTDVAERVCGIER